MERDFWISTWQAGKIGFHLGSVNPNLLAHHQVLRGTRVFVPLCGKSVDLTFLAQKGRQVVGVELSELAVTQFFDEQQLTPDVSRDGELTRYASGPITIFCGDLFALTPAQLGRVDAFYDRAALVALPDELRRRYVSHMATLLPAPVVGLLVTFEYPQEQMSGPPFSVPQALVRALYEPAFHVELRASRNILGEEPRFADRGVTSLMERVYRITRSDEPTDG